MTQELVMTLVGSECTCIETGECTCDEMTCEGDCQCIDCEMEIVSGGCGCGGNCSCQDSYRE